MVFKFRDKGFLSGQFVASVDVGESGFGFKFTSAIKKNCVVACDGLVEKRASSNSNWANWSIILAEIVPLNYSRF